jgi:hypothetical protein
MVLTTIKLVVTSSTATGAAVSVPTVEPEMRTTTKLPGVKANPGEGEGVGHRVGEDVKE